MHLLLVALALQLRTVAFAPPAAQRAPTDALADSVRDARRARNEQASFERARKSWLPREPDNGDRCEVRVGRFCWWADETKPDLPPEAPSIVARRALLIGLFDSLAAIHPGDDWITGMAVHYRLEAHYLGGADSSARACRGTAWWCAALVGYAAHVRGEAAIADSAFSASLALMPGEQRCEWTDIHALLPGDARDRYERLSCADRARVDARYWALGRPRLTAAANDWRNEFFTRRVQAWLAGRSLTPQALSWGDDAEELLLRFGWPVRWSRVDRAFATMTPEVTIVGHDPWPSFDFGPREELLDTLATASDDGWDLHSRQSVTRFAPFRIERVEGVSTQFARFRRADSTLVVAAFFVSDDSLRAPEARLGVVLQDGRTAASKPDSTLSGALSVLVPGVAMLAGVEIADSVSESLARSRSLFPRRVDAPLTLSDLLFYRGGGDQPDGLDSALVRALAGERIARTDPLGIYWEAYHSADGDSARVTVTVERVDHGFFRSAGQRLGLAEADSPLKMNWTDARPVVGGRSAYAVSLDLSRLAAGRYRVSLVVADGSGGSATTSRELELTDR